MKTIEVNVYSFAELSPEAQQTAIENYRDKGIETQCYWDEAHKSVEAFHDLFGTNQGYNSWLDVRADRIDDVVLELKGLRLRKYLINNFGWKIYKGKYYSLWSKTEKSFKHHKDGYPVLKSRYSKVFFDSCCPLTGVCYDDSLLQPFTDFIDKYREVTHAESTTFEDLLKEAFSNLKNDLENEDEYRNSDKGIREELEDQDYEYTEDGEEF